MTAIDDKYAQTGIAALLGAPTGPEGAALNGGSFRHYQYGSIYCSAAGPAHEIHGAIHDKYATLGWERGALGFPTTDETNTPDGIGRYNHFERGSIYWTPQTGAHAVYGVIREVWGAKGWETGPGYPATDVFQASDFANIELCYFSNRTYIASPAVSPAEPFLLSAGKGNALLVVVPNQDFARAARDFLSHKRRTGMPTFLHVLDPIDRTDPAALEAAPFRLKGVIAEAACYLSVGYVLLLGDPSLIPARHRCTTQVPSGHVASVWYVPTDFFYADLFENGLWRAVPVGSQPEWVEPHSWDDNGNNRFNEHHWADDAHTSNPDNVQAIPWLAIGRVPAHTPEQAASYLSKVISYETTEPSGNGELTVLSDYVYYHDNNALPLASNLISQAGLSAEAVDNVGLDWPAGEATPAGMRKGALWETRMAAASSKAVVYIGHGGPGEWAVDSDTFGVVNNDFVNTFRNVANLPIVLAAGCATHGIMANAPEDGPYLGIDNAAHNYQMTDGTHARDLGDGSAPAPSPVSVPIDVPRPSPLDFPGTSSSGFATSWLLNPSGGGIAYAGEAVVAPNAQSVDFIGRVLSHFKKGEVLGNAWCKGQADYRNAHLTLEDRQAAPRIYFTCMHLFGDPSLRLWWP